MNNICYEEMKALYFQWLRRPVGTESDFFELHGWTRDGFFATGRALEENV